jgi:perosamine synthetase
MNLFNTTISKDSIDLVNETLETTFVSSGKKSDYFEKKLTEILGLSRPVVVNSGTSALHLALIASGVKYGDEVLLSAQTFIATGLAILYLGAKPIFVDIDYMTGNIDYTKIEEKITDKTKAIMVVHWGGYPCDMEEIINISKKYNLSIIEDAAHALGATYKNKIIGNISDFTCFSFQAIKHLTCGDGGAICSLIDENESKLKKIRWFNIDRDNDKTDILGERVYNSDELGFKYHLNDIGAAIGIGNLNSIENKLSRYKEIANIYNKELNNISGLKLFNYKQDRESTYWLFGFHVENRNNFINKLKYNNIPCSVVHLGIDKNHIFGGKDSSLINQRLFDDTQINIPIHDALTDEDINLIINTIKNGW